MTLDSIVESLVHHPRTWFNPCRRQVIFYNHSWFQTKKSFTIIKTFQRIVKCLKKKKKKKELQEDDFMTVDLTAELLVHL